MKLRLFNLSHDFAAPDAVSQPIFLPFGTWAYDDKITQSLDRAHAERIANELNERVARGEPGIPVYQGHPDVPALAPKYPDKGALGWIERITLTNEGLNLYVNWDRFPGKGFKWFSPYWFGDKAGLDNEGKTRVVVDTIASVGLVNNPNISEFRLPNESAEDNQERKHIMPIEELQKLLGLPPEATEDQVKAALAELAKAKESEAAAEQKLATANADCDAAKSEADAAKTEADAAKQELENERQAHAATKTALANEQAKYRKLEALKTKSVTVGLPNEQQLAELKSDSEKRMALVNEYQAKGMKYADAWAAAKRKNPELFK